MDGREARLFLAAMAALDSDSAETGIIEDAEPMTATCTVEYSDE